MNRIENPAKPTAVRASSAISVESALYSTSHDSACSLFGPLHYEPNYAYPLIVWLHSPGDDERQLLRIITMISTRNYVAVAPRGLLVHQPDEPDRLGWPQSAEHIHEAEQRIAECVETAGRQYHVASKRVFLAGFDAGGTMAFRVAMTHPQRFAGVISLGGACPRGHSPLAQFEQIRRLSMFLAVGRDSVTYSPEMACDDLRLFHSAGISITLRQYPCGQQLAPQMLRDMDRWIIDEITGKVTD